MNEIVWEDPPATHWVLEALREKVGHWARMYGGLSPYQARSMAADLLALDPMLRTAVGPVKEKEGAWGVWAKLMAGATDAPRETPPPVPDCPPWAVPFRARGGTHLTDQDYARLAQAYVELHTAGKVPPGILGPWMGMTPSSASGKVAEARMRGLLTAAPHVKRPGGELTGKAKDLLAGRVPVLMPTAEQMEQIAAINAANAAHVDKLSHKGATPTSIARLPGTCQPARMHQVPEALRDAYRAANKAGWLVGLQGNGHLRWSGPTGQVITCSSSPRSTGMSRTLGELRNAGLDIPLRSGKVSKMPVSVRHTA